MKFYHEFEPSGDSFESRQHQSPLLTAVGCLALHFVELQQRVRATSDVLDQEVDRSLSQSPVEHDLDRLDHLIAAHEQRVTFNVGDADSSDVRRELIQLLRDSYKLSQETLNPHLHGIHLRNEAGKRQVEGARLGMTHVIGLGSACAIHILERV